MLNSVPVTWRLCKLSEVISLIYGGGTPDKSKSEYWGGNIFWASVKDMVTFNPHSTQDCITQTGLDDSSSKIVPAGTLIVCTRMAVGIGRIYTTDVAINQDLKAIIPNERITRDFLYFWLEFKRDYFEAIATGTTVKGLRQSLLTDAQVVLPPLIEQERIAEILSSVDDSIRATEAVITHTERVKCGLREDLLTGGLGSEAITRGAVPKGWVSKVLCNVVVNDTTKWNGASGEVPYVGLEHIEQDSGNLKGLGSAAEIVSAKNVFKVGDVLFGKLRPNLKKYWQAEFEGICSTDILVLRPLKGILNEYLYYLVQSNPFLSLAISDAVGTKMPRTSWRRLGGFEFLLPPLPEQRRIVEILSSVDNQIVANRATVDQLRRLKRGLMDDLLTGRVRTVS